MKSELRKIYTIGYSAFSSIDSFIDILKKHNINVLIDVRSIPYSNQYPDYNSEFLEKVLKDNRIHYRHLPEEFGAKQSNEHYFSRAEEISSLVRFPIPKSNRVDSQELNKSELIIDYRKFAKSQSFENGLIKIDTAYSKEDKFVCGIMCSEKSPIDCHRMIMITHVLREVYDICHIINENVIISNDEAENMLINWAKSLKIDIGQSDLFGKCPDVDDCYTAKNVYIGWKLYENRKEI